MYVSRDGRKFLAVKQETYDDLWRAIAHEPIENNDIKQIIIGDVVIVVDSPDFHEWVAKGN